MNTTVQLKLKRLQALRTDEAGVLTSLRNLTEFHEPHLVPHEDRLTLRSAIEQRSVSINDDFLAVFGGLSESLKSVEAEVSAVTEELGEMATRLSAIRSSSRVLVEHVLAARGAMRDNDKRRGAIASFLRQFELSDDEKAVLSGAPSAGAAHADVDAVLAVMERLGTLSAQALELQHGGQGAVGAELRTEIGRWEERGQQILYHFVASRARELGEAGPARARGAAPELEPSVSRALRALRRCRPLHSACVRELATGRSALLADAFELALTAGGGAGGEPPIELLAAEPTAYVGAMLGWVRAAASAERALLAGLCLDASGGADARADGTRAGGGASREDGAAGTPLSSVALADALALALERVSRALALRVEAVVEALSGTAAGGARAGAGRALAPLAPLCWLGLALRAFARQIGALLLEGGAAGGPPDAAQPPALVASMLRCADQAEASADAAMGAQLQRLAHLLGAGPLPPDLRCPAALLDALGGLLELLRAVDRAPAEPRERAARACTLADRSMAALERAVEGAAASPDTGRPARAAAGAPVDVERTVFRLNALSAMEEALAAGAGAAAAAAEHAAEPDASACAAACSEHLARLRASGARLAEALVDEETGALLQRCGLAGKLAALQTAREQPSLQLAAIPSLEPAAMAALMRTFYALLYGASAGSAGASLTPGCDRVADGALRQLAVKGVSRNVSLAHRSLHEAISDARNGYAASEPRVVLHTPAQVDTLLDCAD